MNKVTIFFIIVAGILGTTSCTKKTDPVPESKCGSSRDGQKAWNTTAAADTFPWNDTRWNYYLEGKSRVFQVRIDPVSNVCPGNSVVVSLRARMKPFPSRKIDIRLLYNYGALGISGDTVKSMKYIYPDRIEYLGTGSFGIGDAYKDQPGSFYLTVEWVLEDHFDDTIDLEYFKSQFVYTDVAFTWNEYPL